MISFYPRLPLWFIAIIALISITCIVLAYRKKEAILNRKQHHLLFALRLCSIITLLVMLLCPGRVKKEENLQRSQIVFLVDHSASMATKDQELQNSRFSELRTFLSKHRFKKLKKYPRHLYAFNNSCQKMDNLKDLAKLKPTGSTNLKDAISTIDRDLGLAKTAAIVLLSDGIDHSNFRGGNLATPIFTIQLGTTLSHHRDLRIGNFKVPSKVSEGQEVTIDIPLLLSGFKEQQETVFTIKVDGTIAFSDYIKLHPSQGHKQSFSHTFNEEGIHLISLECKPLTGEVSNLNNHRELVIEVVKEKLEILAYFPLLTNSFRPLLREFQSKNDVTFTACYRINNHSFQIRGRKLNHKFATGLPNSSTELRELTTIILAGHNQELLNVAESMVLEEYVSNGGSLVILGGNNSFAESATGSAMERLLPITHLQESFSPGQFKVVPNSDRPNAFTRQIQDIITDNKSDNEFIINGINRINDIKANASVLLWAEAGSVRHPLVVWQPYGKGKVIAVLSNSFHLWGSSELRKANYSKFWQQLITFANAQDDAHDMLKIAINKSELTTNENIELTALWQRNASPTLKIVADLLDIKSDKVMESLELQKRSHDFFLNIPAPKEGRYMLKVTASEDGKILRQRYKFILVGEIIKENVELRSSQERMLKISAPSRIYKSNQVADLENELLQTVKKNETTINSFLIYDTPSFFLIVVLLLFMEWFLRRYFNLF